MSSNYLNCCGIKEWVLHTYIEKDAKGKFSLNCHKVLQNCASASWWLASFEYARDKTGQIEVEIIGDRPHNKYKLIGPPFITPNCAFVVFSDAHNQKINYGKQFAKFLLKNDFAELVCTKSARNPNSGNMVTVWTARLNFTKIAPWVLKNTVNPTYSATQKMAVDEYIKTHPKCLDRKEWWVPNGDKPRVST